MYKEIRLAIAKEYETVDPSVFGPISASVLPENFSELSVEKRAAQKVVKDQKVGKLGKQSLRFAKQLVYFSYLRRLITLFTSNFRANKSKHVTNRRMILSI